MRHIKDFRKWAFIALGIVALVAVACKTAPAPAPAQPTQAAPAAPAPAAPAPAQPAAAPAPAQPAPAPAAPSQVHVRMAIPEVREQFGDYPVQPYGATPGTGQMGYFDHLLVHDGTSPLAPFVAESYSFSPAGDMLTLKIKPGIKFNTPAVFAGHDYGELTAEDVVWNLDRQNAIVNKDIRSGLGAQLGGTFGPARVVDKYTVEVPLVTKITWGIPLSEFDINDTTLSLASKKAYEMEGAEAVKLVPIGTGPFTIGEWVPNNRGTVHAIPKHWRETSRIGTFTVIQVPEITSRLAMMSTLQADLGAVDFARVRELEKMGLKFMLTQTEADTETVSVIWPGNLWTDFNAKTKEALEPWKSDVYAQDYPWIGCPWGDKCPYTDTNNPPGMSDMEQARIVRWGLSMAIDREGVVDVLQGGLGTPIYQELMSPLHPGWDAKRTVTKAKVDADIAKYGGTGWPEYNIASPIPNEPWPWEIPTDLARAGKLLDLAGFPKGSNGIRFNINLNKYRCESGDVCLEQADAVGTSWEAVGVKTALLTEEYGAVVVPRMSNRTQAWPVVKNCSMESANFPLDWPPPPADSTFSRPSWGCSFESKFLDYMYININAEREKAKREAMHLDMVDYYYYWQLYSGISQPPRGVAGNPKTIAAWQTRSTQGASWINPQHIVPVAK